MSKYWEETVEMRTPEEMEEYYNYQEDCEEERRLERGANNE